MEDTVKASDGSFWNEDSWVFICIIITMICIALMNIFGK